LRNSVFRENDYIVIPEVYARYFIGIKKTTKKSKIFWSIYNSPSKKIIFNQHCYNTFEGYPLSKNETNTIYKEEKIIATMVVSEDSKQYLNYVFPGMKIFRVHNSIDPKFRKLDLLKLQLGIRTVNKS